MNVFAFSFVLFVLCLYFMLLIYVDCISGGTAAAAHRRSGLATLPSVGAIPYSPHSTSVD